MIHVWLIGGTFSTCNFGYLRCTLSELKSTSVKKRPDPRVFQPIHHDHESNILSYTLAYKNPTQCVIGQYLSKLNLNSKIWSQFASNLNSIRTHVDLRKPIQTQLIVTRSMSNQLIIDLDIINQIYIFCS